MNKLHDFLHAVGLTLALATTLWGSAQAQGNPAAPGPPAVQTNTDGMTDAEVRKVDKEGGKLTLRHAEIKSLDMPAMTMVFAVKDKAMLDKLKVGDKIKFRAVNDGGKFTATELQAP